MKRKIDNYIKRNIHKINNDIADLIRIKSINGNQEENLRALRLFLEKAKNMGFNTAMGAKQDFGIVQMGDGRETVGILVHMDVVGIGDADKWTYSPFEGKVAKGFLWGRGVVDDKGPAVMCLYAMKAIKDLGIPLQKKIMLIVGTCEESEWTDMESFKQEYPLPDYGFSPDGDFPIFNMEKGYCDMELYFTEPHRRDLEVLRAGDSANAVPSKAELKYHDQPLKVWHGASCHTSTPGMGINAICKMAVEENQQDKFHFLRFIQDFLVQDYNGGALRFDDENIPEDRPTLERTTAVPTVLRLTETGVRLRVNLRTAVGVDLGRINAAFEQYAQAYHYDMHIHEYLAPMFISEKEPFIQTMAQVYEAYGFKNSFEKAFGTSYAKSMPHFVSWGPVFPTDLSCAHMEDERLSISSMITATQIYTTFLVETASAVPVLKEKPAQRTSLEKSLYLLGLFTHEPYSYDIPTLVEFTGMNRTTIYRDLTAMVESGLLVRVPDTKKYAIGPMAERLWKAYEKNRR